MDPWKIDEESFPKEGTASEKLEFLLGYAILALSAFNTQPWRFEILKNELMVYADPNRWLRVSDADKWELYISVGCALENFIIATRYFGFTPEIRYFPEGYGSDLVAILGLKPSDLQPREEDIVLFKVISLRQTIRGIYEDRRIPKQDLKRLSSIRLEEDISLYLTDSSEIISKVGDLILRADIMQYADSDYRHEQSWWIGKRVFGESWLEAQIERIKTLYIYQGGKIGEADRDEFLSSSHFGIICSKENTGMAQVNVGQVFERLALMATSLEVGIQHVSPILEVPEIKQELREILKTQFPEMDEDIQHVFRLGYAETEEHTHRRPIEEVLMD